MCLDPYMTRNYCFEYPSVCLDPHMTLNYRVEYPGVFWGFGLHRLWSLGTGWVSASGSFAFF